MCARKADHKRSLIGSVLKNKCPRCREGNLFTDPNPYRFRTTMRMPEECPVCGQKYELQTGFYFGTGYVSYGISVMLMGLVFIIWGLTAGLSVYDNSVVHCLVTGIVLLLALQPVIQRLARSVWIALFVRYDKKRLRVT